MTSILPRGAINPIFGPADHVEQAGIWWMIANKSGANCWRASGGAVFFQTREDAESEFEALKALAT